MSFVRAASPQFFAPASFNQLTADGQLLVSRFDCQFKRLKRSELRTLQRDASQWTSATLAELRKRTEALTAAPVEGDAAPAVPLPDEPDDAESLEAMATRRLLQRVMVGWRAVQSPDGSDMPFSFEALDQTEEEFPGFINACAQAFWASCAPTAAAHLAAKN